MPKKVAVDQLRVGMYLSGLEGSWLNHPFWRTKFLIRSDAELQKLRECGVHECWIDPSKGEDVPVPLPEPALAEVGATASIAAAEPAGAAAPVSESAPPGAEAAPQPSDFVNELDTAAGICERAKIVVRDLLDGARQGKVADPERCLPVVQEITDSIARNNGALISLLRLKKHDDYTYLHSVAVCALMVSLGRELRLDEETCRKAGLAGMLHDLGKALMPQEILLKAGKLTDEEFDIIKTHPAHGHELLASAADIPPEVRDVVLHHHERVDGTGYPAGLAGDAISYLARMGAICDVYDAVTSNRPYKNAWDPAEAIARMASWKGHFDPAIYSAFVRCLGIYPTGSLVRLQSERLAVVLEQNPGAMSEPLVRVFFSAERKERISPIKLNLAEPGCEDYIISRESPANWPVGNIEALWSHGHAAKILGGGAQAGQGSFSGPVRE